MDANGRELILKDEVYAIISCALEIINGIGHGLHEKPYENSLAVEFRHRGIPFIQQPKYPVLWRNLIVGEFIPDLIVYRQIIVDTKTIEHITPSSGGKCSTICGSQVFRSASSSTSKNPNSNGSGSF